MSTLSSAVTQVCGAIGRGVAGLWRLCESVLLLLSPNYCLVCRRKIGSRGQVLCSRCYLDIPLTRFSTTEDNPMTLRAKGVLPHIVHASALVYYSQMNGWREAIHRLKYSGYHYIGREMGRLLGMNLAASPLYRDIDFVVAVPLHPLRRISRGYNQSYYIALGVAQELGVPVKMGLLYRKRHNASQTTTKRRQERWENTKGLFGVVRKGAFEDKRVLLIDDVFTTGATTISCAESIIMAAPSCKLWIAAVAVSEAEFGLEPRARG